MPPKERTNLWNIPSSHDKKSALAFKTRQLFDVHSSAVDGLYEEFDKLTKKAPSTRVSELALSTVNATIRDTKELLAGDPYVDRVTEFVAAGENPQNSDVLLILSTIKAAFARFRKTWRKAWQDAGVDYL